MSTGLIRGLKILEVLAHHWTPMTFGEINQALGGISHASLSRLLDTLRQSGYVHKDALTGRYACGPRLATFAGVRAPGRGEFLLSRYRPVMEEIACRYDVTVVLLERVQDMLVNICRVQTDSSPFMFGEGVVTDQPGEPWMQVLLAFDEVLGGEVTQPAQRALLRETRARGYSYDDQRQRPHFRRLAFPIFDERRRVIGCFGFGGSTLQLNDADLPGIIESVRAQLETLRLDSDLLDWARYFGHSVSCLI